MLLTFYDEILYKQENEAKEIELQNEIDNLLSKKEKLLDLALDGILSKEDLKVKKLAIERQIVDLKARLEEIQKQSVKKKNQKQYLNSLKENILKNLDVNESNLEQYIEKLLDKIIVIDKEERSKLQIILNTKELINIDMSDKLRQLSNLSDKYGTQIKKVPYSHSHAHSNHLFTSTTTFLKKTVHIKSNSRQVTQIL